MPFKRKIDYFSHDGIRQDLKGKTVRGGAVTAGAQITGAVIALLAIPMLSRLLTPEDFGLVAMIGVFASFSAMLIDAGFSSASIQREELSEQQASNLFWISTALGVLMGITLVCVSPLISWFYGESRLIALTIPIALSFCFAGATVQHRALLRRNLAFQRLAIIGLSGQIIGQSVGIAWAWMYYRSPLAYWALVFIPATTALIVMILSWTLCNWRPRLPKRNVGTKALVGFGANATGFNVVNHFARNADNVLIGWWWGETALGYYERAYRLLLVPTQRVVGPLTSVVVPSLSRLTTEPDRYRRAYRRALGVLAITSIPLCGFVAVMCKPIVLTVLGEQWHGSIPVFLALVPAAWITSFSAATGWVYMSWGHVRRQFKWGLFASAILVVVMASCLPFGTIAVAIGVSASMVLLRIPGILVCFSGTPLNLRDLIDPLALPTVTTLVAGTCTAMLTRTWFIDWGSVAVLSVGAVFYAACFCLLYFVTEEGRSTVTNGINDLRLLRNN